MSSREGLDLAVVGATGLIGETLLQVLAERSFPVARLFALESECSPGEACEFRGQSLPVNPLREFDFAQVPLALFAAGTETARGFVPRAAAAGCISIDSSAAFRADAHVPLVVPEVNAAAIADWRDARIIASPNPLAVSLAVALYPLHAAAGITRLRIATYQPVSHAGRAGIEELARQSIAALSGRGPVAPHTLAVRSAFNCVPEIGPFEDHGETREELEISTDLRRLLENDELGVSVTAVQVPVFYGHSAAVHLETRTKVTPEHARVLLEAAQGVVVADGRRAGGSPTVATESANRDTVYVGRIREDLTSERGLNLWVVADNVRKGTASNIVQIAEILVRQHM
jgi:aspartate-semialdehyde dehydrogenase